MDFVDVTDIIPNVKIDLRYYSDYNFVGTRIDGYEEGCALMTRKCALALKRVSDEIIKYGYVIKIFDAYRPCMAVQHFVKWSKNSDDSMKKYFYSNFSKNEIFEKGFIASKSSHSRGSTVDLTIYDLNNHCDLNMGGSFDLFDEKSRYDSFSISEEERKNRKFLRDVMMKYGFIGLDNEWWHFTLKDEPYPDTYFNFVVSRKSVDN